jgi:hypothetical protein
MAHCNKAFYSGNLQPFYSNYQGKNSEWQQYHGMAAYCDCKESYNINPCSQTYITFYSLNLQMLKDKLILPHRQWWWKNFDDIDFWSNDTKQNAQWSTATWMLSSITCHSTDRRSKMMISTGPNVIQLLHPLLLSVDNKLECLPFAGLSSLVWCLWIIKSLPAWSTFLVLLL